MTATGFISRAARPARLRRILAASRRPPDRLHHGTLNVTAPAGAPRPAEQLGLAHTLLPVLDVTDFADRNLPPGHGLGIASDGRGHAAVAAFPGGALPALPAGAVARWLADDPARPAAAQIVVEQFGIPAWDLHSRYRPTVAYRQLPHGGRRVAVRSWLVVRYEPLQAPEAAERRGGGEIGARAAVAAAAARLRARLAAAGAPVAPLDAAATRALLRQVGDADGRGRLLPEVWAGRSATHRTLAVPVTSQEGWFRLLRGPSSGRAERIVTAATLTLSGSGSGSDSGSALCVRAAVRLVGALPQDVTGTPDRLFGSRMAARPAADQSSGLLATLPLADPGGGPAPYVPAHLREGGEAR